MDQKILHDRYRVEQELGRGGMGVVYLCFDQLLQRYVAAKLIAGAGLTSSRRAQVLREAQSNARLDHPNIVAVYDVVESADQSFIVMQYIEGQTLRERPPAGMESIQEAGRQVALALGHAHTKNIVHRDVKPENLLWGEDGSVLLTDFGLAYQLNTMASIEDGLSGTVPYMAPEMVQGEPADGRVDLYALGVILFEWLTGDVPLPAENAYTAILRKLNEDPPEPASINPEVPPDLNQVVRKLLARRPEQRYQTAEDLLRDLTSTPAAPKAVFDADHNLPVEITSFIGREQLLQEIAQLLTENRLVTLMGVGGCGKTRLALRSGYQFLGHFAAGVWWIELEALDDPDLFAQHVVSALKQETAAGQTPMDTVAAFLKSRSALLILNNCEHLIDAAAQFVDTVLQLCPNVHILATSREALGVGGERMVQVASLRFPRAGETFSFDQLLQFEAVQLFSERVGENVPDFEVNEENIAHIARICRQLDGIPLALELAAARVKVLTLEQIINRLEDRFSLLTSGRRTALPRHQTLRATLDWSYDLLTDPERLLFQRLAVFSGGWNLESAEHICAQGDIRDFEVLDLLTQLVDKSMIFIDRRSGTAPRYRLLESLRQYALEKMIASGQVEMLRMRHLEYFLGWLENLVPRSPAAPDPESLEKIELEHDNLRSAYEWGLNEAVPKEKKLRFAVLMGEFWHLRGYNLEGLDRLSALIERLDDDWPGYEAAAVLNIAGHIAYRKSDHNTCRRYWERCLEIARALGAEGDSLVAEALIGLANTATETGDYESPISLFEKAREIFERLSDFRGMGEAMRNLGWAHMRTGDLEMAEPALKEALEIHRNARNLMPMASTLAGLGELEIRRGEYGQAVSFLEESLAMRQKLGEKWGIGVTLGSLGWIALKNGDFDRCRTYLGESLRIRRSIDDKGGLAWCLEKLAEMAFLDNRPEQAVRVFGAAAVTRASIQSVIDPADKPPYDALQARLKELLGEAGYQAAWKDGSRLSLDDTIQLALKP